MTAALSPSAQAALPRALRVLATASNVGDAIAVSRSAPLSDFPPGSPARRLVDAMIAARLLIAEGGDEAPTVRLAHEALIAGWRRAADQLTSDRRDLETRALAEQQFNRWRNAGRSASCLLRNPDLANAVDLDARWGDELAQPLRDYIRQSIRRARFGQTLAAAAAAVFFLVAIVAVFEGLLARSKEREAAMNYRLALDQAAGSVALLDKGFTEGAINSRLMMDLVKRSQETVSQLPADTDDVTAARVRLLLAITPDMVAIGDTGKAREYAETATKIVDGLLAKDAQRFDWRLLRAQSRMVLGDVTFWDGSDAAIAKAQFSGAIDELKALAATKSDDNSSTRICFRAMKTLAMRRARLATSRGLRPPLPTGSIRRRRWRAKRATPVKPTTGCPTPPTRISVSATSLSSKSGSIGKSRNTEKESRSPTRSAPTTVKTPVTSSTLRWVTESWATRW